MKQARIRNTWIVILCLITLWLMVSTGPARAATQRILHEFNFADGFIPEARLIVDCDGNLYGTTSGGGINNCGWGDCGLVFKLSKNAEGRWIETVLHRFNGSDGSGPQGSLIQDAKGNLYGTTPAGGLYSGGTVFELSPKKDGRWTHTILHSFGSTNDGDGPYAELTFGRTGELYGVTYAGGYGSGTVFMLSPSGGGKWAEKILYRFSGEDGANPTAGVFRDQAGRLYGTTEAGGSDDCGVAFELTRNKKGVWVETVMHGFTCGADGTFPYGGLTSDHHGGFYGATIYGGNQNCYSGGCGVIFKLSRCANGQWRQTVLYTFNTISEGDGVWDKPIFGPGGSLYGDTSFGDGFGNVYKLTKGTDARWSETVLFSFNGAGTGWSPTGIVFDRRGHLYGVTSAGGNSKIGQCEGDNGCGLVYQLIP